MQTWQIETMFKALAEQKASGFGNYIPMCIQPILDEWIKETGYKPIMRSTTIHYEYVMVKNPNPEPIKFTNGEIMKDKFGNVVMNNFIMQLGPDGKPITKIVKNDYIPIPKNLR